MGVGAYISMCNGTPYNIRKVNQYKYQMSDENLPDEIPPFSVVNAYVELLTTVFKCSEDDEYWADYEIQSPSRTSTFQLWVNYKTLQRFSFGVTMTAMSALNAPSQGILDLGFVANPASGWKAWNGVSCIIGGADGAFIFSGTRDIGAWLSESLEHLQDRTLRQICLPLSHDSGMHTMTNSTLFATDSMVVTQWRDIAGQLALGIRAFDIRPAIWYGTYYTGHFGNTESPVGWQGGTGQSIGDMVDQVNRFTLTNPELIILHISHDLNTDQRYRGFSQEEWNGLFKLLDGLNHRYQADNGNVDLSSIPLKRFIGEGKPAVIVRFDWDDSGSYTLGNRAGHGFFYKSCLPNLYDAYANTNDPDALVSDQISKMKNERGDPNKPVFSLDWALTMQSWDVAGSNLLTWADRKMTPRLGPCILPAVSKEVFPNVIGLDGVRTTDAVAIAAAINIRAAW